MLKNTNYSISGKSLILNIILITINLIGLSFLVMGYHPAFEANGLLFKILGYVLMASTLVAAFLLEGMLLFAYVARVLVGGLFIVSGLIKANDPKGFAYKLEEYFEDGALAYRIKEWFNWETFTLEYLIDHALLLSVLICIFEIVLGALVLLGAKMKSSSWLMLVMMLFFTFLTWHTKECDPHTTFTDVDTYAINSTAANAKIPQAVDNENITILNQTAETVTIKEVKKPQCVDDCGCFGDAMKGSIGRSLTPAESFWKDIVLLYLVVIIFFSRRKITINNGRENIIMIVFGLVFISFFSYIFTWTFPVLFGLISLLLALWIRRTGGKILGNDWGMILILTVICSIFVTYVLMYLPMRDYRPYHVGSNLRERMVDGVDGEYENFMVYKNLKTQKDTMITNLDESTKSIWGDTDTWSFEKRETKTIKAAIPHAIQQFDPSIPVENLTSVEKEFEPIAAILANNQAQYIDVIDKETGDRYPMSLADFHLPDIDTAMYAIGDTLIRLDESLTDISLKEYILSQEQVILIFSRNLSNGNFSRISRLKEIAEKAKENNIAVIMISTASKEEIIAFREKTGLNIPTVQNDEIEIKAITRSNPSLMVLSNSVVMGKYPFRSTPSWEWLTENILKFD
ncbi:DoxX family protein [Brumimicrobium glaciale]|uniref:DoxX family protein n=1 Tax=Brumimicrobium glaciale TaxID=200475 RepID=A0A4Q4KIV7_9FLAO|nr:DoxX family protein [Brumimicrobium glaciale]RYM32740.1 DoxX family protein [Brumimicrobium glaciale]